MGIYKENCDFCCDDAEHECLECGMKFCTDCKYQMSGDGCCPDCGSDNIKEVMAHQND